MRQRRTNKKTNLRRLGLLNHRQGILWFKNDQCVESSEKVTQGYSLFFSPIWENRSFTPRKSDVGFKCCVDVFININLNVRHKLKLNMTKRH